jgi:exodeoxyribonuclease VII small subunit
MTTTNDTSNTTTFRQAYGVLQKHAETLRNQGEPNIDDLLSIVTESVGAYKVCQERNDAVEKALEKALSETVVPAKEPRGMSKSASTVASPPTPAASATDFEEDDVPF